MNTQSLKKPDYEADFALKNKKPGIFQCLSLIKWSRMTSLLTAPLYEGDLHRLILGLGESLLKLVYQEDKALAGMAVP